MDLNVGSKDINDDLITFFEWAILMGVPPNVVPSFQVMNTTLRARSMIVMDMVQKVRPQQEVQLMRDNILIHRMHKLKNKDLPMSVRSFIPERYDRFDKMRNANRRIKEVTEKLDRIKLQSSKQMEKIKNLNITKAKLQKCTADSVAKQKILEAKVLMLSADLERVKEQDEKLKGNAVVAPDPLNMDEDRAVMSLSKAKAELESFYKHAEDHGDRDKQDRKCAKANLFAAIRKAVQCQPNLILYRTVHKSIGTELETLLHHDASLQNCNRSTIEDSISKSISDAYQRFILRSTQLDAERDALRTITDNYEHLYTDMNEGLTRCFLDTKKELRDEFIKESSHLHLNEGRIKFLQSEIAHNKELLRERSEKMRIMAESQDVVRELVKQSQLGLSTMVGDMKQMQKISGQLVQVREITEKHLQLMKGDFKAGPKIGATNTVRNKKFNSCIPDDAKGFTLVDELKLLETLPMAYLNTLDQGQLFRRHAPIFMYKPDMIRASRYAHLYTVEGFLKQVKDICNLQSHLGQLDKKREFTMSHISVNPDEVRKREFEQNKSIYRILQTVDKHFEQTEDLMLKCKAYYDFLMSTPLKNFIPPCTKVDGKTFKQFENEFLLYYRMVRGAEKAYEDMEF